MNIRKWLKIVAIVFVSYWVITVVALYFHAYRLTHYQKSDAEPRPNIHDINALGLFEILISGVPNPRPENSNVNLNGLKTYKVKGEMKLEIWSLEPLVSKGTVLIFPGYPFTKSTLVDLGEMYYKNGYNAVMVDFRGTGGSDGNSTSLGYYEANDVKTIFDWAHQHFPEDEIIMHGISMGAGACLKSLYENNLDVKTLILTSPSASLARSTESYYKLINLPRYPFADIMTFWMGYQNGFDAFELNYVKYAKEISTPTLVLHVLHEPKVELKDVISIYDNLNGPKKLVTYDQFEVYEPHFLTNATIWESDILRFIE
jgi:pimeloyl-ACP methyl ester carboxylesterase